ncbi:hypothetical protein P4909_06350 [Escherichia coli]
MELILQWVEKQKKIPFILAHPLKKIGPASKIRLKDCTRRPAYPWRQHFHRGYPEDVVKQWQQEEPQDV